MKNIIFLGSKSLGEACFDYLLKSLNGDKYKICCASSNQDSSNVWWHTNSIYQIITEERPDIDFIPMDEKNLEVLSQKITEHEIDMIISVQYNWIIPDQILKMVSHNAINLHNAKLPEYKGFNAVNMHILNDETVYTSTLHWMIEDVDAGEIAYEREFPIAPNVDATQLYEMALMNAVEMFKEFVEDLNSEGPLPRKEMKGDSKFYSRKTLQRKVITDTDSLDTVTKKSRAFSFSDFEPAYFEFNEVKYYVIPETGYNTHENN
mgnify:CR=1 FL=1|tara:strand:- start:3871 stop:4659 length:789 start_codon:yes stop_codon:yes gene_type:complete